VAWQGGLLSVFLMGCYDQESKRWKTVCKVGNGHDDATIARLQGELKPLMTKISADYSKVPEWLDIPRSLVPDWIINDPKTYLSLSLSSIDRSEIDACVIVVSGPVWEIVGSEFSKADRHTADGISIRFPRVVRIRYAKLTCFFYYEDIHFELYKSISFLLLCVFFF
jgi:DNA ligase-3